MKIKKSRLIAIIREEITEARLRKRIRGVIREFTSGGSVGGAEHKGFKSTTRKAAQSDFDTKSRDLTTKSTAYDTAVAAVDDTKRYRKATKGGGYTYTHRPTSGYTTNPDWTAWNADILATGGEKNTAKTAKDSASTTLDTEKAADLEKTVSKQKPPTGGGAGFGKGKSAGTAKGKKKKN